MEASEWSEQSGKWTVNLVRENKDGVKEKRRGAFHNVIKITDQHPGILSPRHIILATGHSGEPYFPTDITGINDFKGDRLIHSAYFTQPKENAKGKKAIVVGCCNSGHDIARDYYDHGYDVTMIQRSSTLVVKSDTLMEVTMTGLYDESGVRRKHSAHDLLISTKESIDSPLPPFQPPVEDADLINMSIPNPISKSLQTTATKEMIRRDTPLLQGLSAAGFAVDSGPDGSGLWMKYLHRGGGYYIDVGTSQLIADRKIEIKQGKGIQAVKSHSLVLENDEELEADEIVFATGFQNMRETARKIFGDGLADQVGDVWGFDEEGETRGMWRFSGHRGFWFMGGNLALCRFYSRLLALQILGMEIGVMKV